MLTRERVRDIICSEGLAEVERAMALYGRQRTIRVSADLLWLEALRESRDLRPSAAVAKCRRALRVYRQQEDQRGEAHARLLLGDLTRALGMSRKVWPQYQAALSAYHAVGDQAGCADVHISRGRYHFALGQHGEGLAEYEAALSLYRRARQRRGIAEALNSLGDVARITDRLGESLRYHEQALVVCKEIGDRHGVARTLNCIGGTLRAMGRYDEAIDFHRQASSLFQELGSWIGEMRARQFTGYALHMAGRWEEAIAILEGEVLPVFEERDYRHGQADTLNIIGAALHQLGRDEEALSRFSRARSILDTVDYVLSRANALRGSGDALRSLGSLQEALRVYREAEGMYAKLAMSIRSAIAGTLAAEVQAQLRHEAIPAEQRSVNAFLVGVAERAARLLESLDRTDAEQQVFLTRHSRDPQEALVFARQWNSWQPLVPTDIPCLGGGYLLRWAGRGVAIDPGPGFLVLLREAGYGLEDIDAILATHNHIDHVAELPDILTLFHERNQLPGVAHRRLDLFLAPSVYASHAYLVAGSTDVGRVERLVPDQPLELGAYHLRVSPFRAQHRELGGASNAISVGISLVSGHRSRTLVGTVVLMGDTGWSEELPVVRALGPMARPLALIAHLGSVYPGDVRQLHPNHLGYRGLAALVGYLSCHGQLPRALGVSEFGLECRSIIPDIIGFTAEMTGGSCRVFDGTAGRTLLLPSMTVACDYRKPDGSICGLPHKWYGQSDDLGGIIFRCKLHRPRRK